MTLLSIKGSNFRNLESFELHPTPGFNLIYGLNGSGKSSLLEAIYYLARGRSFRTNYAARVIRNGSDKFLIHGRVSDKNGMEVSAGIERESSGASKIHISGNKVKSASELLELMPLQLIDPDSFHLIDSGPKFRRQFMDWGLFHVEHSFFSLWKKVDRCIKQRNAALRQGLAENHIRAWDEEYVAASHELAELRRVYIDSLKDSFFKVLAELGEFPEVTLSYYQGWKTGRELSEVLDDSLARDRILGYTQNGPHRSDLLIRSNNTPADEVLSRGEQKIVVAALHLTQCKLLKNKTNQSPVCLVDDLSAELDKNRRVAFLNMLASFNSQVFLTGVDKSLSKLLPSKGCGLFEISAGELI